MPRIYIKAGLSVQSSKATVYDLAGKVILEKHLCIGSNTAKINLENLKQGIYLLRIGNENTVNNYKIIKK